MCILCCGGFVICRSYFVDGSDKMLDAADVLYDMTRDLEDSGDDMFYLGESVRNNTLLAIPTCPEAEVILDYTDVYLDSVNEYNDIIDPIPGDINDVRGFADDGSQNIQQGLWSLVSVFTLICIFNVLSFSLRKRLMMRIALGIGLVLIHCTLIAWMGATVMLVSSCVVYTLLYGCMHVFTYVRVFCLILLLCIIIQMILSDFCMAPTDNAISLSEASVEDMAYYYGTCNGTNPLYEPISSSVDAVTALAATVTTLTEEGGACEDNPYLLATYPSIANMFGNISFIEQASDCPPIQNEWANLYNESFCHSYFIAMYAMFWTLSCLLVCHFLLMITSSLISQYFDEYWETGDIIGGMDPTALNENLLESANQLQPDGSLTLSSAVMDSSGHNMQIRYSNYTHNVPNTTTNDALLEKKVDYDSEPQIRKSAGDAGSRGSLFEEM
jgi:hypothetical protein